MTIYRNLEAENLIDYSISVSVSVSSERDPNENLCDFEREKLLLCAGWIVGRLRVRVMNNTSINISDPPL